MTNKVTVIIFAVIISFSVEAGLALFCKFMHLNSCTNPGQFYADPMDGVGSL